MTNIREKLRAIFSSVLAAILFPRLWIVILVPLLSWTATASLFTVAKNYKDSPLAYVLYSLSAYALVIVCCALPKLIRDVRARIADSAFIQSIDKTRLGHVYLTNAAFRDRVSLGVGLVVNVWYALSWGVAGVHSYSVHASSAQSVQSAQSAQSVQSGQASQAAA